MNAALADFEAIGPYLRGDVFDANLAIKYQRQPEVPFRDDLLVELCKDQRVLHIGCCDHIPLIGEKIEKKQWLHKLITDCSSYTLGVDIDDAAVRAARNISGYDNIISGDVTSRDLIPDIAYRFFDLAIFGEVVEHISNPAAFLGAFRENYRSAVAQIVVTVPNAFRGGNLLGALARRETINTDHRFFFTPYTISKIMVDAGFSPQSVTMAAFTRAGRIKSYILKKRPLLAEDIVLMAK